MMTQHANVWGPPLWSYIHTLCAMMSSDQLQEKQKEDVYHAIRQILHVIPCKYCAADYSAWLDILGHERELYRRYRADPFYPFKWSVDLHNFVNAKLQKPCWTLENAKQVYGLS